MKQQITVRVNQSYVISMHILNAKGKGTTLNLLLIHSDRQTLVYNLDYCFLWIVTKQYQQWLSLIWKKDSPSKLQVISCCRHNNQFVLLLLWNLGSGKITRAGTTFPTLREYWISLMVNCNPVYLFTAVAWAASQNNPQYLYEPTVMDSECQTNTI